MEGRFIFKVMVAKHKLKLSIDMVPGSSWGMNLRKILPQGQWDKIRKKVHERNSRKCEICGSPERIQCHENWRYDDDAKTQTLVGFGTVCGMCHHVMHFGRTNQLAAQYPNIVEDTIRHFMEVNRCDKKAFDKHHQEAHALWWERSSHPWDVDYGEHADLVEEIERKREKMAAKKAR